MSTYRTHSTWLAGTWSHRRSLLMQTKTKTKTKAFFCDGSVGAPSWCYHFGDRSVDWNPPLLGCLLLCCCKLMFKWQLCCFFFFQGINKSTDLHFFCIYLALQLPDFLNFPMRGHLHVKFSASAKHVFRMTIYTISECMFSEFLFSECMFSIRVYKRKRQGGPLMYRLHL